MFFIVRLFFSILEALCCVRSHVMEFDRVRCSLYLRSLSGQLLYAVNLVMYDEGVVVFNRKVLCLIEKVG